MENQIVVFELGSEFFGADIAKVESIIKIQPIIQLPHAPGFMEGVTNLRGKVLPVINLRKRFGMPAQETNKDSRIIVVTVNQTEVGVVVDGVTEVLRVAEESVEPVPSMINSVNSDFLKGIVRLEDRLIILLEMEKVLNPEEQKSLTALPA